MHFLPHYPLFYDVCRSSCYSGARGKVFLWYTVTNFKFGGSVWSLVSFLGWEWSHLRAGNLTSHPLSLLLLIPPTPQPLPALCEERPMLFGCESYIGFTLWPQCWPVLVEENLYIKCSLQKEVCLQRLCSLKERADFSLTWNCQYFMPCSDFLLLC